MGSCLIQGRMGANVSDRIAEICCRARRFPSPVPLAGRGRGWGFAGEISLVATPLPNPPTQGGREQICWSRPQYFAETSRTDKVACESATMRQKSDEQRRARPAGARRDRKLVSRTMEEPVR